MATRRTGAKSATAARKPRTTGAQDGPLGLTATKKRKLVFIGGFIAYFAVLWLLWNTPVVYPLKVFVVLLHEVSHGLAAVATGGAIRAITLTLDQGGTCNCPGGNAFVTLSAGYLGSVAWGALLIAISTGRVSRHLAALGVIGALIAAMTVLYIRNLFGLIFGLIAGVALIAVARWRNAIAHRAVLTVLGLTSCLYAILDIKSDILDRPELRSDAAMLAELTHVPTAIWGMIWIAIAVVVPVLLLRRSVAKA
ncbi:MAG: M50 family metallopeptidase [Gemmatimonadetes bacterium]|nr:M50 family metallopeptidase [Gemmatimonadota bacterium]